MLKEMLTEGFSLFIDGQYQPLVRVFRVIEDGGKLRVLTKFRLSEGQDGPKLDFGGRDMILAYKKCGPRDNYTLDEVVLYVHGLKVRRRWLTLKPQECAYGYIEYWADDWRYRV